MQLLRISPTVDRPTRLEGPAERFSVATGAFDGDHSELDSSAETVL